MLGVSTISLMLVLAVVSTGVAGQLQPHAEVSAALEKIRARHSLPGMVAALVEGGEVTQIGAAGVRKHGESDPITIHDRIHLGSCTKAMTATVLATFVDQGQLQWDSRLEDVLPQLGEAMHEDWRGVTVRQLLTHRSGLPANSHRMHTVDSSADERAQREELFAELLREKPAYPPGSEFRYSNLGYMLAGLVAETLGDEPWERLLQRRLFAPLEMSTAGFGPPSTDGRLDQPWGHRSVFFLGLRPSQDDNPVVLGPAGRVHATLSDWARFVALHLHHQPARPLVSKELIDQMHQVGEGEEYAMGWGVVSRDWAEGVALTHSGSNTFWYAVVWAAPTRDLIFLAATNVGGSNAAKACDEAVVSLFSYIGTERSPDADEP
jgi:CubicO group peptidase (beta-lactamase class C family)